MSQLDVEGGFEVVFVDDGSTDGTADIIRQEAVGLPFQIVTHARNRGLGAALRTGFAASTGEEVVTLDSDCTYDPLQVVDLLECLRSGQDVVTGSPYHPQGVVVDASRWRLLLSKQLSTLYALVIPLHLYTYTSCLRAYRREALRTLRVDHDGFLAVTDLLVTPILRGMRVAEIPSRLERRRFGRSKVSVVRVSLSHIRYLLRIALSKKAVGPPRADTPVAECRHAAPSITVD
jgi:dolichol-phosphate mannosyltransferase